ncbi:hypothetical protein ACH4NS_01685 [Streptomyces mutabilis]|uniref:hypothetical protein n=1 Tax=Streptomyces mutabilis TaxID=67332 RepID=UPI000BCA3F98|nr:hypothetical protein [Streptomyces sp. Alain-F2R5]MDG9690639.1 hypothetical protein [Streptomyces sp. DH17]PAM97812.1 hypothetical protein CJI59_32385 [Streptomyces sp. Alain-F2R5]
MGTAFATMMLAVAAPLITLWLACAVLGVHGLLLGRMPGRWLQRHVGQPRVWGAGALSVAVGGFSHPTVAVIGLGLIALGHAMKPSP